MRTFTDNEALTDAELDRLGDFLKGCKGGKAGGLGKGFPHSVTLGEQKASIEWFS